MKTQAEEPKRLQSLTLKVESDCLMTSHIGIIPDCEAGTAKPDPTATALSLNGLHNIQTHDETKDMSNNNNKALDFSSSVSK